LGTDMLTYNNYAKQILNGTFSSKEPYYYGPLYFYFLALIYKIFGIDPYFPRLIQMILGVFTTFLTYLIAKKVFNKPIGYISLIISILYAMFYIHEGVLLMEALVTFLNTLSIFLLLRIEDNPSYKNLAFAGISLGLSALARTNILLFIPFLLPWMLINSKFKIQNSKFLRYGFLCLIVLLTISPATIRNYLASGKFVLVSTNGPVNLWIGNNPYAEGVFRYPPLSYRDKIEKMVKEQGDKVYIKEILRFIKKNPKGFFLLQLKKFLLFWDRYEIENNINYNFQKGFSYLFKFPLFLGFGPISLLAICGLFLSLRGWKKLFLLYLFIITFMLSFIPFFITARHRISGVPLLIIFTGFSILWLYEKIKNKNYKSLFLSLILLFFSFLLAYSQTISSRLCHLIHQEGLHIAPPEGILIRDTTNDRHRGKSFEMRSVGDIIKKELILKEKLSKFKKAVLQLILSIGNNAGTLTIEVNNKIEFPVVFSYSQGLLDLYRIELNLDCLNEGLNTIVLKSTGRMEINVAIDNFYFFGRSYVFKDGKWKKLKKGEFMIWLELVR
ncbi:MAG: glycosyltransferase family 39 protein, partial [bacterium]